jgi:DNA-binding NtrC family response regulator
MKIGGWMLATIAGMTLALVGCSKEGKIDTAALESSFSSAEATLKASADKAVAAIKSADYSGAVAELKKLAENAKLTPEQQRAIKDVLAQVEKAIGEAANKAAGEATKAVQDVKKALPKQ